MDLLPVTGSLTHCHSLRRSSAAVGTSFVCALGRWFIIFSVRSVVLQRRNGGGLFVCSFMNTCLLALNFELRSEWRNKGLCQESGS